MLNAFHAKYGHYEDFSCVEYVKYKRIFFKKTYKF